MANDYIEDFMSTLPKYQRKEMHKILGEEEELDLIKSKEEYESELEKLISKINEESPEPLMKTREQKNKTNSEDFNETFSEVNIDLNSLFHQSTGLDNIISKHHQLNKSGLMMIKDNIKQIENEVERYMMLLGNNEGFVDSFYETFLTSSNVEKDSKYYTDPASGGIIENDRRAEIDQTGESLKLATTESIDAITNDNGSKMAKVNILRQPGSGFIGEANKTYDIEKAIDTDLESFWGEVILSDKEMRIDFSDFNITEGAFCEFEVVFNSLSVISEITMAPFTEFPIDVLGIRSYDGLEDSAEITEIITPDNSIPIDEPETIQFEAIESRRLVFVVNQKHYRENNYLIKKSERNNIEMWQKISNKEKEVTLSGNWEDEERENINPTVSQDFLNTISGWDLYERKLKEFNRMVAKNRSSSNTWGLIGGILTAGAVVMTGGALSPALTLGALGAGIGVGNAIKEGLLEDYDFRKDKLVEVDKKEYIYGLYDLDIRGNKYLNSSIYVSKPISTPPNLAQVALDTTEVHPDVDGKEVTDIEFYVTNMDEPTDDDWYPILPNNKKIIKSERLFLDARTSKARLKFEVEKMNSIEIYKNSEKLPASKYDISNISENGRVITEVTFHDFEINAIYSASYRPKSSAHLIDFTSSEDTTKLTATEKFKNGAGRNGSINLKHYPYIDYEKINMAEKAEEDGYDPNTNNYRPIEVKLNGEFEGINTSVIQPYHKNTAGPATKNTTDYTSKIQTTLRGYDKDSNPYFEYRQDGNKLFFNDTFNEYDNVDSIRANAEIEVKYSYLISKLRVKAVMRRNVPGNESVTPILEDYTLKFKTVNIG